MHSGFVFGAKRSPRCRGKMGRCNLRFLISTCVVLIRCIFQGKDLFMDLDEGALKLIDPENLTVLNTQPIHTIRVWGVGRDNGRSV